MGYLVLTRKEGEHITIKAEPGTNAESLLAQLLLDGITVRVSKAEEGRVRIGIEAPQDMLILRAELEDC